uniref:Uncharacterized protein n=1 Tax=Populus trichocarpa TaxID=3694 RepID=A0A2K2AGP2_POPTR
MEATTLRHSLPFSFTYHSHLTSKLLPQKPFLSSNFPSFFLPGPPISITDATNHHHSCHQNHHHGGHNSQLTGPQRALLKFAKTIGWMDLANLFRENLQLCFCSASLSLYHCRCLLFQVSASLDALTDITDGKVNIHVLIMALACFASVFMGNTLEGGLLFAMFNLAHIAEEFFTNRSVIDDVKELKENYPDSAFVLDVNDDKLPDVSHLSYKKVYLCMI